LAIVANRHQIAIVTQARHFKLAQSSCGLYNADGMDNPFFWLFCISFSAAVLINLFWRWRWQQLGSKHQSLQQESKQLRQILAQLGREFELVMEAGRDSMVIIERPHMHVYKYNELAANLLGLQAGSNKTVCSQLNIDKKLKQALQQAASQAPTTLSIQLEPGACLQHQGRSYWQIQSDILHGDPFFVLVKILDITQQHYDDQRRRDFAANASHELRTPLTVVNGYLETLLDDPGEWNDHEQLRYFIEKIYKHSQKLAAIINDMLSLAKLENQSQESIKKTRFEWQEFSQALRERFAHRVDEGSYKLSFSSPEQLSCHAERFYLEQVLVNLIDNAIKYNPKGNIEIRVSAQIEQNKLLIKVEDNGIGISSKHLPFIFERFYRAENPLTPQVKGTGLGLAIVRRMIENQHGQISVSSSPGLNTCFSIMLPQEEQ